MILDLDRALKSWEADLSTPATELSKRALVVLYGAPCTGKTTVGKEVARRLNAYRLSMDLVRASLVPARLPEEQRYDPDLNIQLFDFLTRCASSAVAKGLSVVCEALLIDPRRLERLSSMAAEKSTAIHSFLLKAPLPELERRLASRELSGLNSEGLPESTMRKSDLHRLTHLCRRHPGTVRVFDTFLTSPSAIVSEIIQVVYQKRVASGEQ